MHFEGQPGDPVFGGNVTMTYDGNPLSAWDVMLDNANETARNGLAVNVDDQGKQYGLSLTVLSPQTLQVGAYNDAVGRDSTDSPKPLLSMIVANQLCESSTGRFNVVELATKGQDAEMLIRATASFEQQCAGSKTVVRGCVHIAQW
jgi:hypothetical protein